MWRNPFKRQSSHPQRDEAELNRLAATAMVMETEEDRWFGPPMDRDVLRVAVDTARLGSVGDIQEWGWSENLARIRYTLAHSEVLTVEEMGRAREVLDRIEHGAYCDMAFQPDAWALITDAEHFEQWHGAKTQVRDLIPDPMEDDEPSRFGSVMGRSELLEAFDQLPDTAVQEFRTYGWSPSAARIWDSLKYADPMSADEIARARILLERVVDDARHGQAFGAANPYSVISDQESYENWIASDTAARAAHELTQPVPQPRMQEGGPVMTSSEVDEVSQETGRSVSRIVNALIQLRYAFAGHGQGNHNARNMILAQAAQIRELTAEKDRLLIEVAAAVEQQNGLAQKLEAARARHDEPEAAYETSEDYARALNAGEAQPPLWQRVERLSDMLAERGPYEEETAEQAAQADEGIDRYRQRILEDAEQLPPAHRQMVQIAVNEISWWSRVDDQATETEYATAQHIDAQTAGAEAEIVETPPDYADAPPIEDYSFEEFGEPPHEVNGRPWREPPQMEAGS